MGDWATLAGFDSITKKTFNVSYDGLAAQYLDHCLEGLAFDVIKPYECWSNKEVNVLIAKKRQALYRKCGNPTGNV